MPHKIAYIQNNVCGIIQFEDNKVKIFKSDYKITEYEEPRLYVVVNLKILYDKIDHIDYEGNQIISGIYKILNNTQHSHVRNIKLLMERCKNIFVASDKLSNYKQKFVAFIEEYVGLLHTFNESEEKLERELAHLNEQHTDSYQQDMRRTSQLAKVEKRLDKCRKEKQEVIQTIQLMRSKNESLTLEIDNILFDNIIMVDKTLENFERLSKLEKLINT